MCSRSTCISNVCVASDQHGSWRYPCQDVFVYDRTTRKIERVSVSSIGNQGNGASGQNDPQTAISADGRYVAFTSAASTLVPGDTNNRTDVFLHDPKTGTTTLVSVGSGYRCDAGLAQFGSALTAE